MVKYKKTTIKPLTKGEVPFDTFWSTFSGKPNAFWPFWGSIFGNMRVAKMVNLKRLVLKAITKRNALADTK